MADQDITPGSDLERFLAFYRSVGFEIDVGDSSPYFGAERTVYVRPDSGGTDVTINGGYFGFYTVASFATSGEFLEQGSYE